MTLCLSWKRNNTIHFSSDSRVSTDEESYADIGIKVMEIPVIINGPRDFNTGIERTVYNYKIGISYCGSTVTAHLLKETISEVLLNLQVLPDSDSFSFEGICNVVKLFFERTAEELINGADLEPDIEFLLGGYCPQHQEVLVYKFDLIEIDNVSFEVIFDRVLEENEEYIALGSGAGNAENILNTLEEIPDNKYLKVLKQICKDENVPSVGGFLQYGKFQNNNFKVYGVQDYIQNDNGGLEFIYPFRGTILYENDLNIRDLGFHIAANFIQPFEDEVF
ncbi:hypothetical protein ACWBC2_06145 [Salegentibacter agarivorans]|jgi:hypothetical protein|uniref:Uncharacterized protein n=1 Tax=Christiangramia sediminicola TaxID=3073267 RepID=A0ABU1ELF3_9FLAO|nr:hypothetical protein [Christiangramia sp. SM2212]MDR5589013.1 hypothetical protein [Christiangramia sp. SM2212]|tara:strand:+ start:1151 stop:1984 length:834 start_codon:yes stop_codon:yes gene_type:complete